MTRSGSDKPLKGEGDVSESFEQLGLLVALTPQEQPQSAVRDSTVWDFREVREATDLPQRLLMGYRDDTSFAKVRDGFSVGYVLDGERVLDLAVEGERLRWSQRWRGLDGGGGFVPAAKPGLMVQLLPVFDSWQDEIERSLHEQGNYHLQRQQPDGLHMAGMPDGVFVTVVFPVHRLWLPALVGASTSSSGLGWDRGPCPTAYAYLGEMAATQVWPASLTPDEVKQMTHALPGSYHRVEYEQQLGFSQPVPDEPVPLENGFEVTIRRVGLMHIATLQLRDLLPYTGKLVEAGIIGERRFEDDPSDLDNWEEATAARWSW